MEAIRKETDSKLSDFGEILIAEAESMYSSLISDNPADWSKVGHSCRRMLEILADAVFPPRANAYVGKDGKSHAIGQQQYINRIVCFVDSKADGIRRRLLIAEIEYFDSYINCLKEDICAIEHETSFKEKYYINLAAVRTYLLISELIKLSEQKAS